MSFTDQKPRIVTEKEYHGKWGGYTDGRRFRCYMCGHRFQIGDIFRWVCPKNSGVINFMVCEKCDGPDIVDRWIERVKELETKFWWAKGY
jgi:hypothetical protein